MKIRSSVLGLLAVSVVLAGCKTTEVASGSNKQTGQALGTLLGAATGAILAENRGPGGKIFAAIVGGVVGAAIGGAVGNALDETERKQASEATQKVLAASKPADAPAYTNVAPSSPPAPQQTAKWTSDTRGDVSGSSTVIAYRATTSGDECRTVRELAVIAGKEVVQNSEYCRNPATGSWEVA